jgi:arsenate reductase
VEILTGYKKWKSWEMTMEERGRKIIEACLKKVAFICVHNSCRSQIAEALGKYLASDVFESYSAGTETKPQINQDAVRIMKELYGIDMELTQYSKRITDIPSPDVAISMGCNVGCPFIGRAFDDNWGLEDPTGKSDEEFKIIIKEIENKILHLKNEWM